MMHKEIETHPLSTFIPNDTKLLMLGAFPPKREKWSMDFFYPNFINDMWRIFGLILHNDKEYFVDQSNKRFRIEDIKDMLQSKKIALGDTAKSVVRLKDNASDKFLHVVETIDLDYVLKQMPQCNAIVTTGEKAASVLASITNTQIPKVGEYVELNISSTSSLKHYRMPSSSRAYPMKLETKAEYYKNMLIEIGIL